jgi:hypothetical protein
MSGVIPPLQACLHGMEGTTSLSFTFTNIKHLKTLTYVVAVLNTILCHTLHMSLQSTFKQYSSQGRFEIREYAYYEPEKPQIVIRLCKNELNWWHSVVHWKVLTSDGSLRSASANLDTAVPTYLQQQFTSAILWSYLYLLPTLPAIMQYKAFGRWSYQACW